MANSIFRISLITLPLFLFACKEVECDLIESDPEQYIYETSIGASDNSAIWSFDRSIMFCGSKDDLISAFKVTQQGSILWMKYFDVGENAYANGLVESADHEIFICGAASRVSGTVKSNLLLLKLTPMGDTVWTKTFETVMSTGGERILLTKEQHLLVVGQTNVFESDSFRNISISKLDLQGILLWTKTFYSNTIDRAFGLIETLNGEYIVSGSRSLPGEYSELLLIRFDKNGDLLWEQKLGPQVKHGASTIELANGDLVSCGNYNNTNGSPETFSSLLVVKMNSYGSIIWEKEYGDSVFGEHGQCIKANHDGSFTISGYVLGSSSPGSDPLLLKIDSDGKMLWCEINTEPKYGSGTNLLKDIDDNNIVIGRDNGDTFMSIHNNH